MPLYEYKCAKCEARFELIQKFSDPPEAECPECGGRGERLLSAPAIQFKGSGWYVTDYANKGAPPADASSDSPSGKGETSKDSTGDGSGKSPSDKPAKESKPAGKAKSKTEKKVSPAKP